MFEPDLINKGESNLILEKLGGVQGLSEKLMSSLKTGISWEEVERREQT